MALYQFWHIINDKMVKIRCEHSSLYVNVLVVWLHVWHHVKFLGCQSYSGFIWIIQTIIHSVTSVVHVSVYVAVFLRVWQTLQHLNSSLDPALNWQLAPVSTNKCEYIISYLILITTVYLELHWHTNKTSQFYVIDQKLMSNMV